MTVSDVAVLGAGPAGLAAGLTAVRRGLSVTVVERAPAVGGLAGSFEVAGIRVDHGSHRLHPSIDAAWLAELRRLLGDELQVRPRHGRIRLDGRWVAFPLRPVDLAWHAPPPLAVGAALDVLLAAPRRRIAARRVAPPDSFEARARDGLGPTITRRFYEPYARKLWGVEAAGLSGELYRRRVSAGSSGGLLRRVVGRSGASTFLYPAGGFGRISDVLADAFVAAGGDLRVSCPVVRLRFGSSGPTVDLGDGSSLQPVTVLSTLPISTVVTLAGDAAPPEVTTSAAALEVRGAVLVYLVVDHRPYTSFDAHYFPAASNPVARLSEPSNYRTSAADPDNRTVLCAELPATVGDPTWSADDDDLAGLVRRALVADGLPDPRPLDVVVRRVPAVYPVYRIGFEHHLAVLEQWAGSIPGFVVLGRQGLFAHDNTHHGLAMGQAAAECLGSDGTFDAGQWSRRRQSFRDHVVED